MAMLQTSFHAYYKARLLEQLPEETYFQVIEEQMAVHAVYIYNARVQFITKFEPIFQQYYRYISEDKELVSLSYLSQLHDRELTTALARTRERDLILGYTTQGIHKDDFEMKLGDYPIKRVGSQGQNKTYLIALKLAQFEFLSQTHGVQPLLLLDDIFDKLDASRVRRIVELVGSERFGQIFITDTNREHLDEILTQIAQTASIFYVENGVITEQKTLI